MFNPLSKQVIAMVPMVWHITHLSKPSERALELFFPMSVQKLNKPCISRSRGKRDKHGDNLQGKMAGICGGTRGVSVRTTGTFSGSGSGTPSAGRGPCRRRQDGAGWSPSNWCPFSPFLFWLGGFPY